MIDTINGATSSAIIYSIAETAKANNLKPYEYFEYLLTQIPAHMDDTDRSFLEDLLPQTAEYPAERAGEPLRKLELRFELLRGRLETAGVSGALF